MKIKADLTEKDSNLKRLNELQILYLRNMQRIKWRYKAIGDILGGKTKTTYKVTNIEFCVLQYRKILELIALSSLVPDADLYRQQLDNIDKMWNARYIIKDLERINPNFYPIPIVSDPKDKSNWLDQDKPYLNKELFIKIYDRCGKFMHEVTPFVSDNDMDKGYFEVEKEFEYWSTLIVNLLSTHTVHLHSETELFYISMGKGDDRPFGNIFQQVDILTSDDSKSFHN